jgi:hypothetical protein
MCRRATGTKQTPLSIGSMYMSTHVLLGNPNNLFVFDFGRSGTGSAPFNGDVDDIEKSWELVQRNVSISGSRGALYRPPKRQQAATVLGRSNVV